MMSGMQGVMQRVVATLLFLTMSTVASAEPGGAPPPTHFRTIAVDGHKIFYREAGDPAAPAVILLHGFPGSSFAYRDLIPLLSDRYHVIAPDMLAFGFSDSPSRAKYHYTFDNLTVVTDHLLQKLGLGRYVLYVCDYGATVGYRLALAHPERVMAIISQNGNAYQEGIHSADWDVIRAAWKNPSRKNRAALRNFSSPKWTKYQWVGGVTDESLISPDTYTLASAIQDKGDNRDIMADLLANFGTEEVMYPKYQAYFRQYQPPLLAVWGRNDPFFMWQAAEAFKRDLPRAEIHLYEASHFALETHGAEIAAEIRRFLDQIK